MNVFNDEKSLEIFLEPEKVFMGRMSKRQYYNRLHPFTSLKLLRRKGRTYTRTVKGDMILNILKLITEIDKSDLRLQGIELLKDQLPEFAEELILDNPPLHRMIYGDGEVHK